MEGYLFCRFEEVNDFCYFYNNIEKEKTTFNDDCYLLLFNMEKSSTNTGIVDDRYLMFITLL